MDIRWMRSNVVLVVLLVIAMTAVGALSALVVQQQSAVHGQGYLGPASPADAPAQEGPVAPAIAAAHPDSAAGPHPATSPRAQEGTAAEPLPGALTPDPATAPGLPAPHIVVVLPAPQVVTVPEVVPAPHLNPAPQLPRKPVAQKTRPHRQTQPLAPAPQPIPAQPAIPPATTPDPGQTPTKREIFDKYATGAGSEEKGGPDGTPVTKQTWPGMATKPNIPEAAQPGPPALKTGTSRPSWVPADVGMDSPARRAPTADEIRARTKIPTSFPR